MSLPTAQFENAPAVTRQVQLAYNTTEVASAPVQRVQTQTSKTKTKRHRPAASVRDKTIAHPQSPYTLISLH
ncbi:hypothetical protein OUZ56_030933 [Daphnia magna]|uniref:Uncharacterized protein n=1 Tax=Daphnia magna TaxID=35525 RepID=A0ABQ9ZSQ9_9CRUS|nr:hypothetical protein OUZ56_030933 [Daphnia magna]